MQEAANWWSSEFDGEGIDSGDEGLHIGSLYVVLSRINYGFPRPSIWRWKAAAYGKFHVAADPGLLHQKPPCPFDSPPLLMLTAMESR